MGKLQQQGRNDQPHGGESGGRYGMTAGGTETRSGQDDRGRESATGGAFDRSDRASASSTPVEEGGRQGSSGQSSNKLSAASTNRERSSSGDGNGSGNGATQEGQRSGEQGRDRTREASSQGPRGELAFRPSFERGEGRFDRGAAGSEGNESRAGWNEGGRSFADERGPGSNAWMRGGAQPRRQWRRSPQFARDVMTRNPKTVKPTDAVQQIAQLMVDEDTGIIPVVDNGRLVGVVTDRDIVCRLVATGTDLKAAKASDVMTSEVECVTEEDSLHEVLQVMGEHQIRRVAVVSKDDRLVGIISMADLAREADVDESLQDAFEEISAERSFWSKMR